MDEWEVISDTPAYYLEEGDQIVWKGEAITLDDVTDFGDVLVIEWTDDLDLEHTDKVDPDRTIELWGYVL
jgi:hypothetical protein